MTSYTNVFGGNAVKPADVSFQALAITANLTFNWPSTGISPYTSSIIEISSDAARDITMPDARQVSAGETVSIKNTGAFTLTVKDAAGGAIVSVLTNTVYDVIVKTNTTAAGTWTYLQRGVGSSVADAAALDGNGLEASGGLLRTKSDNTSYSISSSISEAQRGGVNVWTGGGGTFTLGAAATLTDGWYTFMKNNGSGVLTIAVTGSEVFNGTAAVTKTLSPGQGCMVTTDGANFSTIDMDPPTAATFSYATISVAGTGDYTLSSTEYANQAIKLTGLLTGARNIIVPTPAQQWIISNQTTGAFSLTVKTVAGTGVVVTQTKSAFLYSDGTNVVAGETDEGSGIATPVSIVDGGTGATTAAAALTNLGGTATGTSIFGAANAAAVRSVAAAAGTGDANVFTATQTTTSTDAGATEAPIDDNFRNSASPAAADILGAYQLSGKSSTGVTRIYAKIRASIKTATNTLEDGLLAIRTILAGTEADRVIVGAGMYTANASGGDKGIDTINATTLYQGGATIASVYAPLASPTLTGVPVAPTAAVDTNTTQLATTAYVIGQTYAKPASQAEMEAASSNTVAVTPGRTQNHPGVAKFWAFCAGTGTLTASYNMTSVTDTGTGDLDGTIATDFSSANWCLVASILAGTLDVTSTFRNNFININAQAAGTFGLQGSQVAVDNTTIGNQDVSFVDPTSYFVVGYGDQ